MIFILTFSSFYSASAFHIRLLCLAADAGYINSIACSSYAEHCISYDRFCPTIWPSVCHTLVSCQNDSSYDHAVFAGG